MSSPPDEADLELLPETEEDLTELDAQAELSALVPPSTSALHDTPSAKRTTGDATDVLEAINQLNRIRDLDTLLEQVLYQARALVLSDAGTIYLRARDRLFFSYVQNDTLFTGAEAQTRYVYSSSLQIDRASLAGYVAATADPLLIDDVYDIPTNVSYSFNPEYDSKSHYKTGSMLIVPLLTRDETVVGVLQLINAKDDDNNTVPFSGRDLMFALQFAQNAADAIERARLSREMVLRLVELSALRDPFETGQHAKRVGAYSVELYEKWATLNNVDRAEIKANREIIRTAAMLHDVGKVAISDTILRKGSGLNDAERNRMRLHTIYGARLFRRLDSPWDTMAREVALNHHERWDGTGYPGRIDDIFANKIRVGRPKKAEEIPIVARIVSLCDVYDALISRRAYKEAWDDPDVEDYLKWQSGKHFDPVLVKLFFAMQDVVMAIRRKYSF